MPADEVLAMPEPAELEFSSRQRAMLAFIEAERIVRAETAGGKLVPEEADNRLEQILEEKYRELENAPASDGGAGD
jgi:hypothetical protein